MTKKAPYAAAAWVPSKVRHFMEKFSIKRRPSLIIVVESYRVDQKNRDLEKFKIFLTHSILKLKSIVIPLNQMSQSGEKHAQD